MLKVCYTEVLKMMLCHAEDSLKCLHLSKFLYQLKLLTSVVLCYLSWISSQQCWICVWLLYQYIRISIFFFNKVLNSSVPHGCWTKYCTPFQMACSFWTKIKCEHYFGGKNKLMQYVRKAWWASVFHFRSLPEEKI